MKDAQNNKLKEKWLANRGTLKGIFLLAMSDTDLLKEKKRKRIELFRWYLLRETELSQSFY